MIDRPIATPTISDGNNALANGPAGVTVLAAIDSAPGLSDGMVGVPALVALPGTAGAPFSRVRIYNDGCMSLSRFGPRPIGEGWSIAVDGAITANPAGPGYPAGMVLPI